jgi:hypothetical protein
LVFFKVVDYILRSGPGKQEDGMKFQFAISSAMAVILSLEMGIALAQNSTGSTSLGDLARQLKAQRAKSDAKPRVFTNDDLPAPPPGEQAAGSSAKSSATTKETNPGQQSADETGEETHGEKYFRRRMSKLQDRLNIHQRELSVLEQKLGQNQMMYYPDPNKGLLQESGPTAMSDVGDLQGQIAKKKGEITADQEAIENLQDQLRREGGDPAWLRSSKETHEETETDQAGYNSAVPEDKAKAKEYWQARFKSARAHLADAKERLRLAEDELNLLQIQDARELDSNVKAELAEKIKAKESEIAQRRAATKEAQKTLNDLQNRFKASGAPDEWSETETETVP